MRRPWLVISLLSCALAYAEPAPESAITPIAKPALADTPPTEIALRLGAENSWPPFSDANGQGISTELIKAALAETNLKLKFQVLPYARVLHDLSTGKIDGGYNVSLQKTTEDRFVFGQVPLVVVEAYWFFIPGKHPEVKTIREVPGNFRVGVIRDYEYGDTYETYRGKFKEVRLSQQAQIIKMLQQGRLDAAVMFDKEEEYTLRKMNLPLDTLEKRFLNHRGGVYLAFSRKNPLSPRLAEQLDQGLLKIISNGRYQQILSNTGN